MEISRETVNEWLDQHRRTREWLAEQCSVGIAAVGHWLNKKGEAVPIPSRHQITISKLMDEDAAKEAARPLQNLILEFTDAQYSPIEKAALAARLTVREWARQTLNDAAAEDMEALAREVKSRPELLDSASANEGRRETA